MVNIYKSDSDITKHDLTYQASSDFKISLDDNYIGVDPTWTIGDHPLHAISFDVSYENTKTLILSINLPYITKLLFSLSTADIYKSI